MLDKLQQIGEQQNDLLRQILELQKVSYGDIHRELREIKIRTQEMGR